MEQIRFYSATDAYGAFSNFAGYPTTLQGKVWATSEHYFQAQKFGEGREREAIRKARSPSVAAKMGRDRRRKLRRDWESVKVQVMREALWAKFTQHEDLKQLLLSTGEVEIVEHTGRDAYWGDGGDGRGRNMLGRLLRETRERLREGEVTGI